MDDQLSKVFAALADPTRRDLVARLTVGDATKFLEKNAKSCAELLACAVKVNKTIAIDPAVNALLQADGTPTLHGVKEGRGEPRRSRGRACCTGPVVCTLLKELTPGRGRNAAELCPPHRHQALRLTP